MSADDGGPAARREVAHRLFAAAYDDADLEYSDSEEERAPNYVVTPTGARVNRLFVVGVLTEVEAVSDGVLRARVVDPTGAFVVYAGQYQPDAVAFLEGAEVPSFVALTGKARTFRPDDGDRVYTSVRPESMTTVDAATRDRWTVQAAEHTLARVATMARALDREERGEALEAALREAGVAPGLAAGVALALDHYGTTPGYLSAVRQQALAAAGVAAGDRDEVPSLDLAPADDGPVEGDLTAAPAVHGTLTAADATPLAAAVAAAPTTGGGSASVEAAAQAEPSSGAETGGTGDATTDGEQPSESPDDQTAGDAVEPVDAEATEDAAEPVDAEATVDTAEPVDAEATVDTAEPADDVATEDSFEPTDAEPTVDAAEPAGVDAAPSTDPPADGAAAEGELYELDEAEREAVEAEFGTEFSTGGEVGEPGEAGIEPEAGRPATPAGEDAAGEAPDSAVAPEATPAEDDDGAAADEADAATVDEGEVDGAATSDGDDATDDGSHEGADLEDAVVEAMADLDDGDGADRAAVVAAVIEAHGADKGAVEDAVQDALMGGRCYEPSDGTLKAI